MQSMTGFGRAQVKDSDIILDITVKTVNGRFLEAKVHAPRMYSSLETEVRKKVSKIILRGTAEIYINRRSFGQKDIVHFNEKLAEKWLKGYRKVSSKLKLKSTEDSQILLHIPDFFKVDESGEISAQEKKLFFKGLDQALQSCLKERCREGVALKKDISSHLQSLKKEVLNLKKMRKANLDLLKDRYHQRLKKLGYPGEVDEQRLTQEVVMQVDKCDVSEEIQRLEAHIDAIKKLVAKSGTIGKKLDFFAQELLREVNTVGSKSASAQMTQAVVDAKGMVEKFREQVQNVE